MHDRNFAPIAIQVSRLFRLSEDVGLRRAALCTVYVSLDCTSKHSQALINNPGLLAAKRGVLDSLLHVADDQVIAEVDPGAGGQDLTRALVMAPVMVDTLEWLIQSYSSDADATSRQLKASIVNLCKQVIE